MFFETEVKPLPVEAEQNICAVTYSADLGQYLVLVDTQKNQGIVSYGLQQEIAGAFQTIDTITVGTRPLFFQQSSPNAYRVVGIDECGEVHISDSSTHRSILVQSDLDDQGAVLLNWNAYQGRTIKKYQIWTIGSDGEEELIDSVNADQYWYRYLETREGSLQYFIKATTEDSLLCFSAVFPPDLTDGIYSNYANIQRIRRLSWGRAEPTHLFPNPTRGEINLGGSIAPDVVDIFDGTGQKIRTVMRAKKVDLSPYTSGVYYLRIRKNGVVEFKKVIRI
jgi:hypothetical protein